MWSAILRESEGDINHNCCHKRSDVEPTMSLLKKPKIKRLLSLTQSEVIGLDDDEYIKVNVTQLKKKIFLFIGNKWEKIY